MPLTLKNFNKVPITTPGIYHNATLGLISLSNNGTNWITIADKNLGATQVWNDGDTLSEANCGKFYQRGNNYGFPFTGATSTSSTQVNTSSYGPNNYYSNSTFIKRLKNPYDWSSNRNDDLRGDTTDTLIARRGPCNKGFHIPKSSEWQGLFNALSSLSANQKKIYLKLPYAGCLSYGSGGSDSKGTDGRYWSSSVYSIDQSYDVALSYNNPTALNMKSNGNSIRPFKNTPIQPDSNWTVLYQPS